MHLKTYLFIFNLLVSFAASAATLTYDEYRHQVEQHDPGYAGAQLQSEGAEKLTDFYDSFTDAQLFIKLNDLDDRRPTLAPSFQGSRTNSRMLSLGVQKQTQWGPSFSLSQNISHTTIFNATLPEPNFYDVYPELEATIPLWRNLFGVATQAQVRISKADTDIERTKAEIQKIQKSADIELAYYELATNQENLTIHNEILSRAQKIYQWAKDQQRRGLVDRSDAYQAEAALTLRKIDLEEAQNELHNSARRFNSLRGIDSDTISEKLVNTPVDINVLKLKRDPHKTRKDQFIENQSLEIQKMNYILKEENASPQLDVVLKSQWVGRDRYYGAADSESRTKDQPYYYAGLQFMMPLNVFKYYKAMGGLKKMSMGESKLIAASVRDQKVTWEEFVDMGLSLSERIQLLRSLEETQKNKSDSERIRLQRGRSTTFQVLTFEQDYISARRQRILAELKARQFKTQIKLYE